MIDKYKIDNEIREVMQQPMTAGNVALLAQLHQARECVGSMCDELTDGEARDWAAHMDPPAKWSQEQTTAVMQARGYHHNPQDFWLAMCAMQSDYGKVAQKYNVDKPEFFADLADAFLSDPDVRKGKLARYYRDIVEH